jgi:phospholipid/cholesterol/gamma-HCH transport system substrate-binding protein
MDEKVIQFRVGVMFLATLLIGAILLVLFGKLPRYIGHYTIYVRFSNANGVTRYTPIRKSGILIGRVSDVQLVDSDSGVLVSAEIDNDKKLYQDETCTIKREYLGMGDTSLIFSANKDLGNLVGKLIEPNSTILGYESTDPSGLKSALSDPINTVNTTGRALEQAALSLQMLSNKIDKLLDEKRDKIDSGLDDAAESLAAIRTILGNKQNQDNLAEAMRTLPSTLENMNQAFATTNASLQKFTEPNEHGITPIQQIREIIDNTSSKFEKGGDVDKILSNVKDLASAVQQVIKNIDNEDGTLGALIHKRELYDHLNRTARNVEELTQKLEPIVDDVRVITDKVARHPGVPLRDALKPGPGIK